MGSKKLGLSGAQMAARKKLMRRIVDFETSYVLRDDKKGTMIVLAFESAGWRIMEDIAANPADGQVEELHEIAIGKDGIDAIRMALKHWSADKMPGRPPKYDAEREGQEIFVYHVYGGKSIRAIARDLSMGPATVQKLLNKVRFSVADRFVSGELHLDASSPNYEKNLSVIRWAMKNSIGEDRSRYAEYLKSKVSDT